MSIATRFLTLLRADAHGVVDALEDQTLLLRQHLREAECELDRKRSRLAAIDDEEGQLEERSERLQQTESDLEADTQLAIENDKEDLARFAIKKLLGARRARSAADRRLETLRQERLLLAERLAEQEGELAHLEERVRARLERRAGESSPFDSAPISEEEVELELLRRQPKEESQ